MLYLFRHKKGQALLEYAVVIALIALGGFTAMKLVGPKYEKQITAVGATVEPTAVKLKTALEN